MVLDRKWQQKSRIWRGNYTEETSKSLVTFAGQFWTLRHHRSWYAILFSCLYCPIIWPSENWDWDAYASWSFPWNFLQERNILDDTRLLSLYGWFQLFHLSYWILKDVCSLNSLYIGALELIILESCLGLDFGSCHGFVFSINLTWGTHRLPFSTSRVLSIVSLLDFNLS